MRSTLAVLFVFCAALVTARAQSVRWEPSDSGASTIQLVFEECVPDGAPELPTVPGVTFRKAGESSSTNIINFDVRRSVIYTYIVSSRQNAPIQIPTFTVKTNRGVLRVAPFNGAAPASAAGAVASSRLVPARTSVWAGEVFPFTYELTAASRSNPQISPNFEWSSAPLTIEDWSKPEVNEDTAGGERRARVIYRTRASTKTPNTVKLEAASHLINIQTGTVGFGFFTQSRMEPISVTSDQPVITVRPLPGGAPAGFSGAVGEFDLVSKVVPENAGVGEPITWTLELKGTGNWPDIGGLPTRDVSTDFQVVQPKAKRTPIEGKLFDVTLTEDVVLVPTKPGTYALGPIAFSYFDPKSGTYKTRTTPRTTVSIGVAPPPKFAFKVTPPENAPAPYSPSAITLPPPSNQPSQPTGEVQPDPAQLELLKSKAPPPPGGIPRDPLASTARAAAPLSVRTWLVCLLSPVLLPLSVWLWLAVRRAHANDPVRPRREARARLGRTLAQLKSGSPSPRLLLAWQHDTAVLWQIRHAAPGASALADSVWSTLWSECDRALYGTKPDLPSDWQARAESALAAQRVAGFNPLRAFLPRNLFPFAALVAFLALALSATQLIAADDPVASYRRGDFAAAEKAWRSAVTSNPLNPGARHNLSLALAQQARPGEALAHAAAAFVQAPAEPALRWNFALASDKAGFVPAPLAGFINPGPFHSPAQLASPAVWQRILIGASLALALALCALLHHTYGQRIRFAVPLASVVIVLALLTGAASFAGWQAYGATHDARAVVVLRAGTLRSIPTEADTTQKTSPLAAGSVAVAIGAFLDGRWTRLEFDNGQTGWVRTGELVGLWR